MKGPRDLPYLDPNWEPSEELQAKVWNLARRWSLNRPDLADDLYQEGMLAIWLRDEPDAPMSYHLRTAQEAMLVERKRGRSVDGRMNPVTARAKTWIVLSVDRMMYGIAHHDRTVEAYVVDIITVEEILARLEPRERECLGLIYQGFTQGEVAHQVGYSVHWVNRTIRAIKHKVWPYLYGQEYPRPIPPYPDKLRQPETRAAATSYHVPWTEEEDRIIRERMRDPAHEVALDLGRTLWAVRNRRRRLPKNRES